MDQLNSKEFFLIPKRTPVQQWWRVKRSFIIAMAIIFAGCFLFDLLFLWFVFQKILWVKAFYYSAAVTCLAGLCYKLASLLMFKPSFLPIRVVSKPCRAKGSRR